jgi:hypothetical protein
MTNYAGVAVIVSVLATTTVVGFSLVGQRWTTDVVPVELQLGNAAGLVDGSADWDACARQSLAAWNAALASTAMRFTAVRGMSSSPAVAFDGINSIVFAADVSGTPFGPSLVSATQTIAIIRDGFDETIEADVLVNQAQPFNCYRGTMQPGRAVHDLQRTVTHALGHVIGLGHPDAAGQDVTALMNAGLGDVDTLQLNDLQGALTLAGVAMAGIPFPPRNESLTFYESLEVEYRDTLQRSQTNESYVDAEGSAVWFPEWLRYVLNGCEATEATTRVLMQIRGQGIQPVCSEVEADSYAFPPRNLSLDFLEALDAFYRDELQRSVELSHVDLEGKAVWLQEYLRYRVDGVNDADARSQVLTKIQEAAETPSPPNPSPDTHFIYGQEASMVLSAIGFNDAGGLNTPNDGLLFNHPKGIATDNTRLALADSHNNRVLIWNSIPTTNNVSPDLVLGQTNFTTNNSGRGGASSGLEVMNWPTAVAIYNDDTDIRLAVADTYNDRILIWRSWPTSSGEPATFALASPDIEWPWGVWTDNERLVIASTGGGGTVPVWDRFPTSNTTSDWNFDSNGEMGTPRSIVSDWSSFLAVADHNQPAGISNAQGGFVWASDGRGLPTSSSNHPADCFLEDVTDPMYAWLAGDISTVGDLYMLGRTLHRWTGLPTSRCEDPDFSIDTSSFDFVGGDGSDVVLVDENSDGDDEMLFVSSMNGNRVLGYSTLPTSSSDVPDLVLGSKSTTSNTLDDFFITNPVPACDGNNLYVSSDFERTLQIWTSYPSTSGAAPDYEMDLAIAPWDSALHGTMFVLAGRTDIAIWTTLPATTDYLPDEEYSGSLGSVVFDEIRGVALDDTYLYIADWNRQAVYIWNVSGGFSGLTDPDHTLALSYKPTRLSSDGSVLSVTDTFNHRAELYRIDDFVISATPTPRSTVGGIGTFNLPEQVLISNGQLFAADTSFSRVAVWNSVDTALAGAGHDLLLGKSNEMDRTPEVARDKTFWPAAMCYDGSTLWVGEFKFSGRLLRFDKPVP